jgi:hypothetical protein
MQDKLFLIETNSMPGVMASLIPGHHLHIFGEQVDDLALPFIAPLHSHYNRNRHESLPINNKSE